MSLTCTGRNYHNNRLLVVIFCNAYKSCQRQISLHGLRALFPDYNENKYADFLTLIGLVLWVEVHMYRCPSPGTSLFLSTIIVPGDYFALLRLLTSPNTVDYISQRCRHSCCILVTLSRHFYCGVTFTL